MNLTKKALNDLVLQIATLDDAYDQGEIEDAFY